MLLSCELVLSSRCRPRAVGLTLRTASAILRYSYHLPSQPAYDDDIGLSSASPMSQPQSNFLINGLPIKPSDIPPEDVIVATGREVLAATSNWKQGKTFRKVIKTSTYSPNPKGGNGGAKWACRVSEHTREEGTFDEFWSGLGTNKAENEMQ